MTPEQRMEELSKTYLFAVSAACGYAVAHWSQDQDCIDATLGAPGVLGGGHFADPKLDVQLKSTSNPALLRDEHVALQLPRKQYERLARRSFAPKLLVVLVLPVDEPTWVEVTAEHLLLRRCAYFLHASALEPITTDSKVVHVPFTQRFTPDALRAMMERVSRGEPP